MSEAVDLVVWIVSGVPREPTVSACLGTQGEEVANNACPSCWDCVGRNKAIDGLLELVEQISYPASDPHSAYW